MNYSEHVTAVIGYAGSIAIGRAHRGTWRWHVEIFNRASDLHAHSWREARQMLAVHGAQRVEVHYAVQTHWPAGIEPPHNAYLPPGSKLFARVRPADFPVVGVLSAAVAKKIFEQPDPWQREWFPAFSTTPKNGRI
jgi:hypothetical protein